MAGIIWLGIFVFSRIEAEVNCGLTSKIRYSWTWPS